MQSATKARTSFSFERDIPGLPQAIFPWFPTVKRIYSCFEHVQCRNHMAITALYYTCHPYRKIVPLHHMTWHCCILTSVHALFCVKYKIRSLNKNKKKLDCLFWSNCPLIRMTESPWPIAKSEKNKYKNTIVYKNNCSKMRAENNHVFTVYTIFLFLKHQI